MVSSRTLTRIHHAWKDITTSSSQLPGPGQVFTPNILLIWLPQQYLHLYGPSQMVFVNIICCFLVFCVTFARERGHLMLSCLVIQQPAAKPGLRFHLLLRKLAWVAGMAILKSLAIPSCYLHDLRHSTCHCDCEFNYLSNKTLLL